MPKEIEAETIEQCEGLLALVGNYYHSVLDFQKNFLELWSDQDLIPVRVNETQVLKRHYEITLENLQASSDALKFEFNILKEKLETINDIDKAVFKIKFQEEFNKLDKNLREINIYTNSLKDPSPQLQPTILLSTHIKFLVNAVGEFKKNFDTFALFFFSKHKSQRKQLFTFNEPLLLVFTLLGEMDSKRLANVNKAAHKAHKNAFVYKHKIESRPIIDETTLKKNNITKPSYETIYNNYVNFDLTAFYRKLKSGIFSEQVAAENDYNDQIFKKKSVIQNTLKSFDVEDFKKQARTNLLKYLSEDKSISSIDPKDNSGEYRKYFSKTSNDQKQADVFIELLKELESVKDIYSAKTFLDKLSTAINQSRNIDIKLSNRIKTTGKAITHLYNNVIQKAHTIKGSLPNPSAPNPENYSIQARFEDAKSKIEKLILLNYKRTVDIWYEMLKQENKKLVILIETYLSMEKAILPLEQEYHTAMDQLDNLKENKTASFDMYITHKEYVVSKIKENLDDEKTKLTVFQQKHPEIKKALSILSSSIDPQNQLRFIATYTPEEYDNLMKSIRAISDDQNYIYKAYNACICKNAQNSPPKENQNTSPQNCNDEPEFTPGPSKKLY